MEQLNKRFHYIELLIEKFPYSKYTEFRGKICKFENKFYFKNIFQNFFESCNDYSGCFLPSFKKRPCSFKNELKTIEFKWKFKENDNYYLIEIISSNYKVEINKYIC